VIALATGPFAVAELAAADTVLTHARDLPGAVAALAG
jgi:hypothetical protein